MFFWGNTGNRGNSDPQTLARSTFSLFPFSHNPRIFREHSPPIREHFAVFMVFGLPERRFSSGSRSIYADERR